MRDNEKYDGSGECRTECCDGSCVGAATVRPANRHTSK